MKTHILHLEPYDDIHSIQDKIDWGRSEAVLLVLPLRRPPLQRKLDLLLLQRHAHSAGASIALVTRSRRIKDYAASLNIPVFRSLRQAQQVPWQAAKFETPKPSKPRRRRLRALLAARPAKESAAHQSPGLRWASLILGFLAFAAIIIALLPSAQITLTPRTQPQEIQIELSANPALTALNPAGVLPAEIIPVVVEGRSSLRASGSQAIPQQPAAGEVLFTNLTDQTIELPAGTIVRTIAETPVRFATTEDADLPAEAGSRITVPVEALNPGLSGNLPAESLVTVEGELALSVTVSNPEATGGGTEQDSATPALEDYDTLQEELLADLWQTALAETEAGGAPGNFVIYTEPISISVLEEEFNPPEPAPSAELSLLLRVEYEIMVVPWEALKAAANFNLDAALAPGYTAFPNEVIVLPLDIPALGEGHIARWQAVAQRPVFLQINAQHAAGLAAGGTPSTAADALSQSLDLAAPPDIQIFPNWWPWMPFLSFRTQVASDF